MQPLEQTKLPSFLKRFDNFKECEFRSFVVVDATTFIITFALQDSAREFDWITLSLEFSGVSDARLVDERKMGLVDMADGVSILVDDNNFAFGVGRCDAPSCIKNASYYIISKTIKYKEGAF